MYTLLIGPKGLNSSCTNSHRTAISSADYSAIILAHGKCNSHAICAAGCRILGAHLQTSFAPNFVRLKDIRSWLKGYFGPHKIQQDHAAESDSCAYPQIIFPRVFRQVGHTYAVLLSSLVHAVARVTGSTISEAGRNIASCLCSSSWKVAHATRSTILHTLTTAQLLGLGERVRQASVHLSTLGVDIQPAPQMMQYHVQQAVCIQHGCMAFVQQWTSGTVATGYSHARYYHKHDVSTSFRKSSYLHCKLLGTLPQCV